MKNPLNDKEKTTYSCNGFTITGDCSAQRNKLCSKDLGSCISSNGNNGLSPRTTRRPILPTKDQKIAKMVVNMGTDGTRDDVKMKICSEDNTVCCTSDKLSHLLSREWQENKQETWEAGKFGSKCKKQVFKVNVIVRLTSRFKVEIDISPLHMVYHILIQFFFSGLNVTKIIYY